ncbi:hypothetical protein MMC14_000541 [Varicellaria rhodocarpa]|nr:hypothetical protein [Varicellaria rhodocarpa]
MAPSAISHAIPSTLPSTKAHVTKETNGSHPGEEENQESPLHAICYGPTKLPGIPTFPTFTAHRLWSLNHMTALFRHWSRHAYTEGMSGHISIRDPEYPSLFWTNPLAVHFGLLKTSDMLLLSDDPAHEDRIFAVAGGEANNTHHHQHQHHHHRSSSSTRPGRNGNGNIRPANKAGWAIHAAIHRLRPDVHAACHAHTRHGKAWSATGRKLEMINQDVCNFYGDALTLYENYGGVVVGSAIGEGEAMAKALGEKGKAAILVNHGLLTVGGTVDEAGFLFGLLERCCAVQLDVERAGYEVGEGEGKKRMRVIGDREAEFNFRMASTPETLYWEFQPDYDYEVAMSHDTFEDLTEEDVVICVELS